MQSERATTALDDQKIIRHAPEKQKNVCSLSILAFHNNISLNTARINSAANCCAL